MSTLSLMKGSERERTFLGPPGALLGDPTDDALLRAPEVGRHRLVVAPELEVRDDEAVVGVGVGGEEDKMPS